MLLTFDEYAEIPDKLHIFYSLAFETMFLKHDATKIGYKREIKSNLTFDNFKKIFSIFCFNTYMKEKYVFLYSELIDYLNDINKKGINFDSGKYIEDLKDTVCVIYPEGFSRFLFTHRSFQEYFAALYITNLSDEHMKKVCNFLIKNNSINDDKMTVLKMIMDMSTDKFSENIMIELLEEVERNFDHTISRYDNYLTYLTDDISFEINETTVILSMQDNPYRKNRSEINCIINVAVNFDKNQHKLKGDFKKEEISKLGISENITYSTNDLLLNKNENIYTFIKKETWVGKVTELASTLLERIYCRQKGSNNDLKELLESLNQGEPDYN